jgi:hypothetical protein
MDNEMLLRTMLMFGGSMNHGRREAMLLVIVVDP